MLKRFVVIICLMTSLLVVGCANSKGYDLNVADLHITSEQAYVKGTLKNATDEPHDYLVRFKFLDSNGDVISTGSQKFNRVTKVDTIVFEIMALAPESGEYADIASVELDEIIVS